MGDETRHTINCEGCRSGYDDPKGYIIEWDKLYAVRIVVIGGIEQSAEGVQYHVDCVSGGYSYAEEANLFEDSQNAQVAAILRQEEEVKRIASYEKRKAMPNKSWNWHVCYYRRQIKEAHQTIERATRLLNMAKEHAKSAAPESADEPL